MNIYILERSKINQTIARIVEELAAMENYNQLRFWQLMHAISADQSTFYVESSETLTVILMYLIENKILLSEVCCESLDHLNTIFSIEPSDLTISIGKYLLDVTEYRDHP